MFICSVNVAIIMRPKFVYKEIPTLDLEKLMNESYHNSVVLEERRGENSLVTSVGALIWAKMVACV